MGFKVSKDTSDDHLELNTDNDNLSHEEQMKNQLQWLQQEHRRLDAEIKDLIETGAGDMLKIQRMKKIKLLMKDQITCLMTQLTPDIIA